MITSKDLAGGCDDVSGYPVVGPGGRPGLLSEFVIQSSGISTDVTIFLGEIVFSYCLNFGREGNFNF